MAIWTLKSKVDEHEDYSSKNWTKSWMRWSFMLTSNNLHKFLVPSIFQFNTSIIQILSRIEDKCKWKRMQVKTKDSHELCSQSFLKISSFFANIAILKKALTIFLLFPNKSSSGRKVAIFSYFSAFILNLYQFALNQRKIQKRRRRFIDENEKWLSFRLRLDCGFRAPSAAIINCFLLSLILNWRIA